MKCRAFWGREEMKWEYNAVSLPKIKTMLDPDLTKWLTGQGNQGWELVAVIYVGKDERDQVFYFKRQSLI
jgi:hypothetical protein